MDSFRIVRADFFDQYVDWWRRFFSDAFAWALTQIGQSQDFSWDRAFHVFNDHLLLPLVVLVGLVMLLKRTLSD